MKKIVSCLLFFGTFSASAVAENPFTACMRYLGLASPALNYSFKNQVDSSARTLHYAEAPQFLNYWKHKVSMIAVRDQEVGSSREDAYVVLYMIDGSKTVANALSDRLRKRFGKWVRQATYTDKKGKVHEVLALRPSSEKGGMLFELPVAELMMVESRSELMNEIQKLQAKDLAGAVHVMRHPENSDDMVFTNTENEGFGVPLTGGVKGVNW